MATRKAATVAAKRIKVPLELHPAVTATAQATITEVGEIDLGSNGLLAVTSGDAVKILDAAAQPVSLPPDLARAKAHYVRWSSDATRLATLFPLWTGNEQSAQLAVYSWPEGKLLAAADMKEWGYVTHALAGNNAPMMAFSSDSKRLFVRSSTMGDKEQNEIGVLDIAAGELDVRTVVSDGSYIFSIAVGHGRLFVLFGDSGEKAGLLWFDEATLERKGNVTWPAGECVVPGESGAWAIGDGIWGWRVDTRAIEAGTAKPANAKAEQAAWAAAITLRTKRNAELAARAKAAWDVEFLKSRRLPSISKTSVNFRVAGGMGVEPSPGAEPGVRCFVHHEPWGTTQAARLGADDAITRDGVRVSRWRLVDGSLEVTPLVEDVQRATYAKARLLKLAAWGDRVVIGWRKSLGSRDTICTFFQVDAAAISAAASSK